MILEAKSITKYYGGFCALNDVDIGVDEGEFVSIIGPNSAGKTTLLNVLTGFLILTPVRSSLKGRISQVKGLKN